MFEPVTDNSIQNNSLHERWTDCLRILKKQLSDMSFNTWFLSIKPIGFSENVLTLQLNSQFAWEWIDEHYRSLLHTSVSESFGSGVRISYKVVEELPNPPANGTNIFRATPQSSNGKNKQPEPEVEIPKIDSNLDGKYVFENFIKGTGNELPRAAGIAISENPGGTPMNPFFIYGGVGLGKTHLVQAIGNAILVKHPNKRVRYISTEKFLSDFITALQSEKINDFSAFYKSIDVLIIDDIQFLTGREKMQDIIFHLFNTLHQSGRQIILSSDKPPKDLEGLDERLISRFHWGLTLDIKPPDFETRIAILSRKAQSYGMELSMDILEYIASNVISNIRELEGCLIKLLAVSNLSSREIDLELAKSAVKVISTNRRGSVSIDAITKITCEFVKVDEKKVRDKTRKQEIVEARQISMYLSKKLTGASLKMIGLHFGGRDHSTVIHACDTVDNKMLTNKKFREVVESIQNKLDLNYS